MKEPYTPSHEIAYCMGLIVGEGCFSGDAVPSLIVALHERDPQPLLDLRSVFGGVIYGPYRYADGRRKRMWVLRNWQLQEALPFFDRWLPPSHKREHYDAWRLRYETYFARERRVSRRTVTRESHKNAAHAGQ